MSKPKSAEEVRALILASIQHGKLAGLYTDEWERELDAFDAGLELGRRLERERSKELAGVMKSLTQFASPDIRRIINDTLAQWRKAHE